MEKNITLIGMPGSGKSTVGIILAKMLSYGFLDTDVLIQINQQASLQSILDSKGYMELRDIEESEILKLNISRHIIATGGSAVYGERAMKHLRSSSTIVYIETSIDELLRRVTNFDSRGIAKGKDQSFAELFEERSTLYKRYADITVSSISGKIEETAQAIIAQL